jgi:hypothetical protein
MRMRRQGVDEENEPINLTFCNHRPDLLIPAKRAAFGGCDLHLWATLLDHARRCGSTGHAVLFQNFMVIHNPLGEGFFFVVMRN